MPHTNRLAAGLAAALLAVVAAPSRSNGLPVPLESYFDGARMKDVLAGSIADPANGVGVRTYVSAGSTISATLSSTSAEGTPISDLRLTLYDDSGTDLGIAGGEFDKSVPGTGVIKWKKVPLSPAGAAGGFTFVVGGSSAGDFRLSLSGTMAKLVESTQSSSDLGVGAETSVDVDGLRGATLTFALTPGTGSKFKGELVRIERPDATPIEGAPLAAKGKVVLDVDGTHHLVFRNAGTAAGSWKCVRTVSPPKQFVRHGFVRPAGTAFDPVVTKVSPAKGFHKDDMVAMTLTGRDFQSGADVRLVRKGRADILATGIQVVSERSITCTLNLDTTATPDGPSIGTWNVGVWNAPEYGTPDDRTTLVRDSPTNDTSKTFASVAAASITLPPGVIAGAEVWQLQFDADFQIDLNRMGLGSSDPAVRGAVNQIVQAYTVCFLRDLLRANGTNGKLAAGYSPPICFIVGNVPSVAGKPGVDYNRIEIGGAYEVGDDHDVSEPLMWGYAPLDPGNTHRDDLTVETDDGSGGQVRRGWGARTRVLDPNAPQANADWIAATAPLRNTPLDSTDRKYFSSSFFPSSLSDANRYHDIVTQITRASREIAAIAAHQIGRSMGLSTGGSGPMASPSSAGYMWPTPAGLAFADPPDLATLRTNAVPHQLPGKTVPLLVAYFPLVSMQPYLLPDLTTDTNYSVSWNFVGGRPNALPSDYTVAITYGIKPLGITTLDFNGMAIKAPLYLDASQGLFYAVLARFELDVTDRQRKDTTAFLYRLNVLPNIPELRPGVEQQNATNARNAILNTP